MRRDSSTRHVPSALGPDKETRILNPSGAVAAPQTRVLQLERVPPSERRLVQIGVAAIFLLVGLITGLWVLLHKPAAPEPVADEVVEAPVVPVVEPRPEIDPRDTATIDAVRAEVARSEAARAEAARLEAELAASAKAEAARAEAARAEVARAEVARAETERVAAARAEAARAEAARLEAARAAKADEPKAPKTDALSARYRRVQAAWTKSRASRSPEDRRIFDVMLAEVGKQLGGGSRAEAAESLDDFVAGALNGKEP